MMVSCWLIMVILNYFCSPSLASFQFYQIILMNFYFTFPESVPYSFRIYIQHLMRKLGSDPYIGQHIVLAVSQRISMAAETLLFMDPFDNAFPKMHSSIYLL